MTNKDKKAELNRLLGRRKKSAPKKKIEPAVTPFPVRFRSLGKSKNSTQGVAGWRQGYYRSPTDAH